MFEVGDVVGSYTVLAHLRSGGMADLFLARREGAAGFRRLVAIKVVHPRHAEDEQLVRMFLDEALISARIDHPNVVHVEDLGELDDTYFLVMEYVHGCSLAQLMRVLGKLRRRLSPMVAVAIAARVAEGLHAAHETTDDDGRLVSLVHRDVSPQNILLSHKGHVKLIDFGVAKARLRSEETNVAMLKGKVRYMPPEQATTGVVDRRSDVYSLGIVLWEMLTMRRLFAGKTEFEVLMKVRDPTIEAPSRYVTDVPPELDEVVLSALAKDPAARPQNAKVFRRMLARAAPRSMALDSAHLADLMLSVVGDQLEEVRHDLPEEISRILAAEQLRVAFGEKEEREAEDEIATHESAVDFMTVHSELVAFDEDELDLTPDKDAEVPYAPEDHTRPGSPIAIARSVETTVLASGETAALAAPTEEDAEPTVVGVPDSVVKAAYPPHANDDGLDESTTLPERPKELVDHFAAAPRLVDPVLRPSPDTTAKVRAVAVPRRVWAILLAAAVGISVLVGGVVALAWPLLRADPSTPPSETPPAAAVSARHGAISESAGEPPGGDDATGRREDAPDPAASDGANEGAAADAAEADTTEAEARVDAEARAEAEAQAEAEARAERRARRRRYLRRRRILERRRARRARQQR